MKRKTSIISIILVLFLLFLPLSQANAQSYRFEVTKYNVQAVIEEDGSLTLYYEMTFKNNTGAHPIDFVDIGLPNRSYSLSNISATIDGNPVAKVSHSTYVLGAELALGEYQIPAGGTGEVQAQVTGITDVLFPYDGDDRTDYVNFQFTPSFFDPDVDKSRNSDYTFSIVLPPAVGADDGVYFEPQNWPGDKNALAELTIDSQRVIYTWQTNNADTHSVYLFGAAFPASAVPDSAISTDNAPMEEAFYYPKSSGFISAIQQILRFLPCIVPVIMVGFFMIIGFSQSKFNASRKLAYLPPSLSIEGHGIKRGLTAVEAGILLQEPLDKILTMILFGLLKKEAITVQSQDPLVIVPSTPLPAGLYEYELQFISAFKQENRATQRKQLQDMMIDLVKSLEKKMKGFSGKETKAYYQSIIQRAWQAVEEAETPEIKSAQLDHTLEWTMLDKDFSGRTTRTFVGTPVFLPRWWGRYSPTPFFSGPASGPGTSTGGGVFKPSPSVAGPSSKPSFSLPSLPGAAFASSVIDGGAKMANSVLGNTASFTQGVTSRTNPMPISTSSGSSSGHRGGGGSSCACACACAGCACACAGGGR